MTAPQAATTALTIPDITPDMDALAAAFAYANAGWHVGPVAPGTKHPGSILGKNWTSKTTRDPEIIADTWMTHTDAGIFLHVGRSGGIVLDVDTPTALPDVLTTALTEHPAPFQRTRRHDAARRHYVYAQPAGRTLGNGLGRLPHGWGDIRGMGGVVIVAPSVHPDPDGHYAWGRTGAVPVLPSAIADLLADTGAQPQDVATDAAIRAFITRHHRGDQLDQADAMVRTYRRYVREGDSRHQRAVSILTGMLKEAAAGYYPAAYAEEQLRDAFCQAVTEPGHSPKQGAARTPHGAREEWRGILAWAVAQATAADPAAARERAEEHAPTRDLRDLISQAPAHVETAEPGPAPAPAQAAAPAVSSADSTGSDLARLLGVGTQETPQQAVQTVHPHQDAPTEPTPTWAPVDLTAILDGTYVRPEATLLRRADGRGLLYPGKVHSIYGESESGKSWVAQHAVAEALRAGLRVAYIDFESDAPDVAGRLTSLGVTPADLLTDGFAYIHPEASPQAFHEADAFAQLLAQPWDLAVLDGVTEALGLQGKSTMDNDEITAWMRALPRRIARETGAAVVLIDHVVKATEGRGRFPLGGQAKMAAIDGAAFLVEPLSAIGVGLDGTLTIRVTKDRPGTVRAHAGEWRKTDRTQEAAVLRLDSSAGDGTVTAIVQPPIYGEASSADPEKPFRPTGVMEKMSNILAIAQEQLSQRKARDMYRERGTKATDATIYEALNLLVKEGYVEETVGPRGARMFRSIRPYRAADDPQSESYRGGLAEEFGTPYKD